MLLRRRLASGGTNSFTFLRGDQNFAPVSVSQGCKTRYFADFIHKHQLVLTLIFLSNQNALIGHDVIAYSWYCTNTNITVSTVGGLTTVASNNPPATLAVGTVIQFEKCLSSNI